MLRNLKQVVIMLVAIWLLIIYLESVLQRASTSWPEDGAVEGKQKAVNAALTSAADDTYSCRVNLTV